MLFTSLIRNISYYIVLPVFLHLKIKKMYSPVTGSKSPVVDSFDIPAVIAGYKKDFGIGRIVLSGHSGGYQVMSSILDRGGLTAKVQEVWLFDALYAQADKFLGWFEKGNGRMLNIYTEHGGTKQETEHMLESLKSKGAKVTSGKEEDFKNSGVPRKGAVFIFSELEHNDVLDKHNTFEAFLKTSCLGESSATASESAKP